MDYTRAGQIERALVVQRRYQRTSDGVSTGRSKKLTESQVAEIRRLSNQFKTNHEIAQIFGVNYHLIGKVLRGKYRPAPDEAAS